MDNVTLVHKWFEEVWNNGRLEAIDEMASPDVIAHGQAQHAVDLGMKEFREFAQTLLRAFPGMRVTIDRTVAQDNLVVVRWTAEMTQRGAFLGTPASGRRAVVTGTTMARIEGGKIVEGWDNWDQLGLLVQIGALDPVQFIPTQSISKAS